MTDAGPPGSTPSRAGTLARLLLVSLAVALALWLLPASLHIVGWDGGRARLIALLPSPSALVARLAIVMAGVGAAAWAWRALAGRTVASLARALLPLLLLGVWIVPYVPTLSEYFPLLVALAGPLRWLPAVAAVAGVAYGLALGADGTVAGRWLARPRAPETGWWSIGAGRPHIFAVTVLVFLVSGAYATREQPPGGDEPHYLIIAHSLLVDGDLRIENNHLQRDHDGFFAGALRPHFLQRGRDDVIYSIHAPGLPVLLLPGYAVAGYRGAVVTAGLLAALAAVAVFDVARRLAGTRVALLTWIAVAFSMPLAPHAWMLYPEVPAAAIVAWAVGWLWRALPATAGRWMVRGLALAWLPWLHTKFALLLGGLTLGLLVELWPRRREMVALVAPIVVSIAAWLTAFWVMYGRWHPMTPYGWPHTGTLRPSNIPRGMLGLALDQEFGLLLFTPIFAFAGLGLWRLLQAREHRGRAALLAGVTLIFVSGVTGAYMWWGGASAPARFLVPVAPLLAPMVAVGLAGLRSAAGWGVAVAALGWGLLASGMAIQDPSRRLLIDDRDGVGRLVSAVEGDAPLAAALPSFIASDWVGPLVQATWWVAAGLVALVVARGLLGRLGDTPATRRAWSAGVASAVLLVSGGVVGSAALPESKRSGAADRGRSRLMARVADTRLGAVAYAPLAALTPEAALARATLVASPEDHIQLGGRGTLFGPFDLPSGRFEARVFFRGGAAITEPVQIVYYLRRLRGLVAESVPAASNPVLVPFDLPVPLRGAWVRIRHRATSRLVQRVEIVARAVEPGAYDADVAREIQPIPGVDGAYLIFIDDNTEPTGEGYWVRRQRTGRVLVAPAAATAVSVTLTNLGSVRDTLHLQSGDWTAAIDLAPGATRRLAVPRGTTPLVPLAVTTTADSPGEGRVDCLVTVELVSSAGAPGRFAAASPS